MQPYCTKNLGKFYFPTRKHGTQFINWHGTSFRWWSLAVSSEFQYRILFLKQFYLRLPIIPPRTPRTSWTPRAAAARASSDRVARPAVTTASWSTESTVGTSTIATTGSTPSVVVTWLWSPVKVISTTSWLASTTLCNAKRKSTIVATEVSLSPQVRQKAAPDPVSSVLPVKAQYSTWRETSDAAQQSQVRTAETTQTAIST